MIKGNGRRYVEVSNDYMFQKIFGNPEKPQYFKALYESIFNRKAETVEIIKQTKIDRSSKDNKQIIVDTLGIVNGEYIHIDMQNDVTVGMNERIDFYPGKIVSQITKKGTTYKKIEHIKSVWIFNESLNKKDKIYIDRIKKVYEKRNEEIDNPIIDIYIVELGKIGKYLTEEELQEPLKQWLYFIKAKEVEEMEAIRKINPLIDEAIENECMESEEISDIWMRIREEESERVMLTIIEDAKEKALVEEKEKNKIDMVLNMNKLNFTFDVISQVVNLPKEKVKEIIEREKIPNI